MVIKMVKKHKPSERYGDYGTGTGLRYLSSGEQLSKTRLNFKILFIPERDPNENIIVFKISLNVYKG